MVDLASVEVVAISGASEGAIVTGATWTDAGTVWVVEPVKLTVLKPQGMCRAFSGPPMAVSGPSTAEAGSGPLALRLAEGAGSWPLAVLELLEEVELGPLAVLELLEGVGFEPLAVIPQLWQVCFTPLTFVLLIDGMPPMASLPMCSSCRDECSMRASRLQCNGV